MAQVEIARKSTSSGQVTAGAVIHALAATLIIQALVLQSAGGAGIPNSDDLLRLIQVRDLIAGQSWFDVTQLRLGLENGTLMHWSRLVDGPMAFIILVAKFLGASQEMAETVLRGLWPAVMLFGSMLALTHAVIRTGNRDGLFPVSVIGAIALYSTGTFSFGALDHHNVQIMLGLWLLALILPGRAPVRAHGLAGVAAALMLAIGMEALPYVAMGGIAVAAGFLSGKTTPQAARAFGLSLAGTAVFVLAATVAPSAWSGMACDSFSQFHVALCVVGGGGLALTATFSRQLPGRLAGLALTGAAGLGLLLSLYNHCVGDPLAGLDPRIRTFWLDGVIETRSLADLIASDPFSLPGTYGIAVTAFLVSLAAAARGHGTMRHGALVCAVFLAVAIAVTVWQQRGYVFATAFAILPMTALVISARRAMEHGNRSAVAGVAIAWLLAVNLTWWIGGAQAARLFSSGPTLVEQAANATPYDYCYGENVYEALAREPRGVVLGATDIGASVLVHTHHRAIAGPYHRNTGGILTLIDVMTASPGEAERKIRGAGVTILADCVNSADAHDFAKAAPDGLQAALARGSVPAWLEPVEGTEAMPLKLYRIRK